MRETDDDDNRELRKILDICEEVVYLGITFRISIESNSIIIKIDDLIDSFIKRTRNNIMTVKAFMIGWHSYLIPKLRYVLYTFFLQSEREDEWTGLIASIAEQTRMKFIASCKLYYDLSPRFLLFVNISFLSLIPSILINYENILKDGFEENRRRQIWESMKRLISKSVRNRYTDQLNNIFKGIDFLVKGDSKEKKKAQLKSRLATLNLEIRERYEYGIAKYPKVFASSIIINLLGYNKKLNNKEKVRIVAAANLFRTAYNRIINLKNCIVLDLELQQMNINQAIGVLSEGFDENIVIEDMVKLADKIADEVISLYEEITKLSFEQRELKMKIYRLEIKTAKKRVNSIKEFFDLTDLIYMNYLVNNRL